MSIPFTYGQATEICEDFEDLEGTELVIRGDEPVKCEIEHIIISPFEQQEKQSFIDNYTATGKLNEIAVDEDSYNYDVLLITRNLKDDNEVIVLTIEEYIAMNSVNYNFPG